VQRPERALAVSINYPTPVYVNGYACNNCAQVADAKKGIDPADPKAGPYGIDAANDPRLPGAVDATQSSAVVFGGLLAQGAGGSGAAASPTGSDPRPSDPFGLGKRMNISV
jgi:hypothetical protein